MVYAHKNNSVYMHYISVIFSLKFVLHLLKETKKNSNWTIHTAYTNICFIL